MTFFSYSKSKNNRMIELLCAERITSWCSFGAIMVATRYSLEPVTTYSINSLPPAILQLSFVFTYYVRQVTVKVEIPDDPLLLYPFSFAPRTLNSEKHL